MNETMQCITGRRSIRRYRTEPVPDAALADILRAVQWSPSWANTQCWEIIVIRDRQIKEQLHDTLSPKNPASIAVVSAPVVLAICGRVKSSGYYRETPVTRFGDWMLYDLGLATQNILLAACSHGLGTVVVGAFDHGMAESILKLPEGVQVATLIPLGYPDHHPGPPRRREVGDFTHNERY
jgi:nitroreductase